MRAGEKYVRKAVLTDLAICIMRKRGQRGRLIVFKKILSSSQEARMFKSRRRVVAPLLAFCVCLSAPVASLAAGAGSFSGPKAWSGDSSKSDAKKQAEDKASRDSMNKGSDTLIEGSDLMMKKDKTAMAEGQKLMVKGQRMMKSSGLKDKGSMKMLGGAEMMLKAADMLMSGSESEAKQGERMMADGKYMLLQGKGMMMDGVK
jgi:hypothetical protein